METDIIRILIFSYLLKVIYLTSLIKKIFNILLHHNFCLFKILTYVTFSTASCFLKGKMERNNKLSIVNLNPSV